MLIKHEREKLINTIVYFSQNVKHFGKIKLCKLLYFFDFEHYKITGRSVTGLDYYAWKMGPVPVTLYNELQNPKPDLLEKISLEEIPTRHKNPMLALRPRENTEFNSSLFSKREKKLLETLVSKYKDMKADDIIEATHLDNQPWDKIYNKLNKKEELIPYELALNSQELQEMKKIIHDRKEFIDALS